VRWDVRAKELRERGEGEGWNVRYLMELMVKEVWCSAIEGASSLGEFLDAVFSAHTLEPAYGLNQLCFCFCSRRTRKLDTLDALDNWTDSRLLIAPNLDMDNNAFTQRRIVKVKDE